MVRPRHEHWWEHVKVIENGWICNYCGHKSIKSGASRIEAHLTGKGGNIRRCTNYPPANNQGVYNNMASTSTNPPQAAINTTYSTHDKDTMPGVDGSGDIISVCENEINQLNQLVLDLDCEETDIAKQVQCLESCGKKRKPEVDVWLKELQELKESASNMSNLNDTHDITKLTRKMKWHKEEKPLTLSTEFVGEQLDENIRNVLKLLDDDKVFVIGIYGMGGAGKTLLATLVENELKRKTTFKNVFWVTVSQNTNISKLQHDIARRIGVKLDEEDERIRSNNLSSALEKKEKSVLILDDVWKYIDLKKVGVPLKVNGIKVILTTRLKHLCHQMDCQPYATIEIYLLNCHKEASYEDTDDEVEVDEEWELFMLKLGHDGTPKKLTYEIETIARCIVKWFKGLPLGINVMARTMKGIDDIHQWKHALNKLQKLEMGQEVEEEVFKVLKRSYDNLLEEDMQNCFLYCALISAEDYEEINQKDELIMKLVDNGQINKNMCLEEIFYEGNTILNKLQAHSLIVSFNNRIFIHPLMRSMACYILKQRKRNVIVEFNERSTVIPLSHGWLTNLELVHMRNYGSFCTNIHELEILKLEFLKSLTFICKEVDDVGQPFPQSRIFSCLKEIEIYGCDLIEKLLTPQLAQQLQNLETIRIVSCLSMKEIFAGSNNIDNDSSIIKLPKLTSLRLLNLPELKIVWKGIIHCGAFPKLFINSCPRLERRPTIEIEDF